MRLGYPAHHIPHPNTTNGTLIVPAQARPLFFCSHKKAGLKKHAQRKGPIESTCPAVACRISPSPTLLLTSDGADASYSAASVRDIRFAARKR